MVPSAARLSRKKRFCAPGMWPATLSMVSDASLEAFRRARVHQQRAAVVGAPRDLVDRHVHGRGRTQARNDGAPAALSTPARTARPSAVHLAKPPSSTATARVPGVAQQPPQAARVEARSPGRRRPPASPLPMPSRSKVATSASSEGSGWRPLVPVRGAGEVVVEAGVDRAGNVAARRTARGPTRRWRGRSGSPRRPSRRCARRASRSRRASCRSSCVAYLSVRWPQPRDVGQAGGGDRASGLRPRRADRRPALDDLRALEHRNALLERRVRGEEPASTCR